MWAYYIPNHGFIAFGSEAQIKAIAKEDFEYMIKQLSIMNMSKAACEINNQQDKIGV